VTALKANVVIVAALALPLIFGSHYILQLWMGPAFAAHASLAMSIAGLSFALLGLNVTGHFAFMAMGRVKILTALNAIGAAVMLALIAFLAPRFGIVGAAAGRLAYGPIICLVYFPLWRTLGRQRSTASTQRMIEEAAS
jgi:O-antigen/teichoic acid export membrane protein